MAGKIELLTPSNGKVALVGEDTATDVTVTVPARTGNVAVDGPAFSAYQSTQQTGITSLTFTKVNFETEEFDTNNNFASSRFTPTVAGYYQIDTCVWGSGNILASFLALYKNGSRYKEGGFAPNASAVGEFGETISSVVHLNGSTDYVEIYVWVNLSSGTASLQSSPASTGQLRVWFNGSMIRGA